MVIQDLVSVVVGSLHSLWVGAVGVLGSILGSLIVLIIGLIAASGFIALADRIVVLL